MYNHCLNHSDEKKEAVVDWSSLRYEGAFVELYKLSVFSWRLTRDDKTVTTVFPYAAACHARCVLYRYQDDMSLPLCVFKPRTTG